MLQWVPVCMQEGVVEAAYCGGPAVTLVLKASRVK